METSSGQEMLQEAKKRTPDELEIHVELQAPRVYFPVRGTVGKKGGWEPGWNHEQSDYSAQIRSIFWGQGRHQGPIFTVFGDVFW